MQVTYTCDPTDMDTIQINSTEGSYIQTVDL